MKIQLPEITALSRLIIPSTFYTVHCIQKQAQKYKEHARFYFGKAVYVKGIEEIEYSRLVSLALCYQRAENRLQKLANKYQNVN